MVVDPVLPQMQVVVFEMLGPPSLTDSLGSRSNFMKDACC